MCKIYKNKLKHFMKSGIQMYAVHLNSGSSLRYCYSQKEFFE